MPRIHRTEFALRGFHAIVCAVWLYMFFTPMASLGLLSGAPSFIFPFLVLAIAQCFPRWWAQLSGGIVASFGYILYFWRPGQHLTLAGVIQTLSLLVHQFVGLFTLHLPADPLQTFLFLWVTIGVYWLLAYSSYRVRLWLFYNGLAIVVLAAIDSNTNVHPNGAIVTIIVIGIFVLGLNQLERIRLFVPPGTRPAIRFLLPLCMLLFVGVGVAAVLPKREPVWPNPFSPGAGSGNDTGAGIQMVGYQLNDTKLGGSFVENDNLVMYVYSPHPTYLRGQTLSTYTGKGWVSAKLTGDQMMAEQMNQPFTNMQQYAFYNLPTQTFNEKIEIVSDEVNTSDLLGGYAVKKVSGLPDIYPSNMNIPVDDIQGNIHAPRLKAGSSYVVQTEQLTAPYTVLAKDSTPFAQEEGEIPATVKQYDLQLPSELPKRVGQLADDIIHDDKNASEYTMVSDLVTYLKNNYTYDTTDVPVPGRHQDYVDQFLFDSKSGYCNNFSSALAVMLRTLGVPTRWVTGFADGTQDLGYQGSKDHRYLITNADAHAWVEVYFPEYGWIPFDPTPNFSIPFHEQANAHNSPGTTQLPPPVQPNKPVPPKTPVTTPVKTPPVSSLGTGGGMQVSAVLRAVVWGLAGLISLLLILTWVLRHRIALYRLERQWRTHPERALQRTYRMLMLRLQKRNVLRQAVTLRELWPFAARAGLAEGEFRDWVQTAERVLYGSEPFQSQAAQVMQVTSMKWLRQLYRFSFRHKSAIDDIDSNE
ncbi:transglutaminase domain-containing protein [Alicyclobacillus fodiniaquatilis]|uniref:Transglutaminase domain-containing protein n=1 Tax=Alicyclobacillus fodiniaquatilis TaxID=1661150 RepID=A0ABW4JBN2_9BACL